MARPRHDNRRTRGGWRTSDRLAASSRLERWKAESVPVIFKRQNIPPLPRKLFSPGGTGSYPHSSLQFTAVVFFSPMLCMTAMVQHCFWLFAVICESLNFSEFAEMSKKYFQTSMFSEIFVQVWNGESSFKRYYMPFTNWWVLAHEL